MPDRLLALPLVPPPQARSRVSTLTPRSLTLLLIRHGETTWNAENRWQGQRDIPLSEVGRAQAALLRDRLTAAWRDGALPGPPHAVFTSDLSRAIETADTALSVLLGNTESVPVLRTPLLRERNFGSWEGMTNAEVRAKFGNVSQPEDGEPHEQVYDRMREALALIWHHALLESNRESATAVVVGHGGSLRMTLAHALGISIEEARRFRLANTSISVVTFTGTSPDSLNGAIQTVNDAAHLALLQ